jgi:hypothetical protein
VYDESTGEMLAPPSYDPLPVPSTVVAYAPNGSGGVGKVVATDEVDPLTGQFVLPALEGPVCVQVVSSTPDWQSGWLWPEYMSGDPTWASYVQRVAPPVCNVTGPVDLGMIQLLSGEASGQVVDAVTGEPVVGATVRYDPADASAPPYSAVTGSDGRYSMTGLDFDEYSVKVTAKKYVGGYLGNMCVLYSTHGDAANWGTGVIGCDTDYDPATTPNDQIRVLAR